MASAVKMAGHRRRMATYYARRRELIDKYKTDRGCMDCGWNGHPAVLEFDHRPGTEKNFQLSNGWGKKMEVLIAEMEKCDVVCANCHRLRTVVRRGEF